MFSNIAQKQSSQIDVARQGASSGEVQCENLVHCEQGVMTAMDCSDEKLTKTAKTLPQ